MSRSPGDPIDRVIITLTGRNEVSPVHHEFID